MMYFAKHCNAQTIILGKFPRSIFRISRIQVFELLGHSKWVEKTNTLKEKDNNYQARSQEDMLENTLSFWDPKCSKFAQFLTYLPSWPFLW